jgi:hypothetical protein
MPAVPSASPSEKGLRPAAALGHVDADDAAGRRGARRLASRQAGSAPDVDDVLTGPDPVRGAKVLVVSAQLAVVEVQLSCHCSP